VSCVKAYTQRTCTSVGAILGTPPSHVSDFAIGKPTAFWRGYALQLVHAISTFICKFKMHFTIKYKDHNVPAKYEGGYIHVNIKDIAKEDTDSIYFRVCGVF